ncbi:YbhB/YbcL family Raf kinase inhibitor-like protein [Sphingomonas sp.]|uniref:YbhB/YbcL family Raf kinase inhibitor-like protein n=1 Tax=Sphingomonas sp. TaxID=28214 RepID=UPI0035BC5980
MLEHVPAWLGKALSGMRAGTDALAIARPELGGRFAALDLTSPAFADSARLPERFTADGEGCSPPLIWGPPPAGTAMLALIVEDADSPATQPLVHAIVWGLPASAGTLAEGAVVADGTGDASSGDVGRNSFLREGWLPPDPPTGHGEHRYAFQLFALDEGAADPGATPGRGKVVAAMAGHVLAAGLLVGTYSRGEAAPVGPVGAVAV